MYFELPNNQSKGPKVPFLSEVIAETKALAQEAEWNGDAELAVALHEAVKTMQKRLAAGELYEPNF